MDIESNQDDDFNEFANAGEVEVGKPAGAPENKTPTRPDNKTPTAPSGNDDDDQDGADDENGDDENGDDDENKPPKKTAKDHQIERLKRERAEARRAERELRQRIENIEKGLQGGNSGDTKTAAKAAPDPSDLAKYPLGHLDDRYIEDKLEWLADQKAAAQADRSLQRQQEIEQSLAANERQQEILSKVDALATKGADLFPDFQEEVVETGMRGEWKLDQPTFEACHDADNGAQILYNLSQDPKEAARVASLTPYQQLKYVQEKDAELSSGKRGRTKPQAGDPPRNTARGANSRTHISPATDNLSDFEKAWAQDEKGSK